MPDMARLHTESTIPDDVRYCMTIYEEITGMPPLLSCRRASQATGQRLARARSLKQVKCPHCSTRFADTDDSTRIEVVAKPSARTDPCHLYHKCDVCGTVFEIKIVIVVS